jgi:alanine racemase
MLCGQHQITRRRPHSIRGYRRPYGSDTTLRTECLASPEGSAAASPAGSGTGAILTIDLDGIVENYRLLRQRASDAICAAVLKADAYGLGAAKVGRVLLGAGCRHFFVAHLAEGAALRSILGPGPHIYVLHGPLPGTEPQFGADGLIPVLNSPQQLALWGDLAAKSGRTLPAIIQLDSGMSRFGLASEDVERLASEPLALRGIDILYVMSHLACADDPENPANADQLETFQRLRRLLPPAPATLAASSGLFLGREYHFDLVRPGAALYGVAPVTGNPNPMRQVVRLQAKIVQTRMIKAGRGVGYGLTYHTPAPRRIATIAVGYADGFLRSASNCGSAWYGETELPIVGHISMDSMTLDVSRLPTHVLAPGSLVDLIGPNCPLDTVAASASTIGYEILTSLGHRYHRRYVGGDAPQKDHP